MAKITKNDPHFLDEQFSIITEYIPHRDAISQKVSEVDVAWHLDHMLKTINFICKALEASNPEKFKPNFSITRSLIYAWGDFPRGIAKSPKVVLPPEEIRTEDLFLQIEQAKENLKKIQYLHTNAHFKHPYFKVLNKTQGMRFLKIHTRHHLKIVRDIVKKL